jgi:hypothetical protein
VLLDALERGERALVDLDARAVAARRERFDQLVRVVVRARVRIRCGI